MRRPPLLLATLLLISACDGAVAVTDTEEGSAQGELGVEKPFGDAVMALCRRALGQPYGDWKPGPPPESYRYSGTPNHKLLWRVWAYAWAQETGVDLAKERDWLLTFFSQQQRYGHQAINADSNEVLTASHHQLWVMGMGAARLLAYFYADTALLDATGRWWREEQALYDLLERDGSIDAPGARFKPGQDGPTQLRDDLHVLLGGGTPSHREDWWQQKYNGGAWALREARRMGDDLGGTARVTRADLPRLSDPLYVYSRGDDFVFVFPALHGALQPLFWVARIGGEKTYAPYVNGTPTTSAVPAPELPGADVVIVPGVD